MQFILIFVGFVLLVKGADILVVGGSNLAKKFNVPELVIGMTIVSIGTSMPELVISLNSALSEHSDISVGNIIGSNMANIFLILAICAIIKELTFKKQTKWIENEIAVLATTLLLFFANNTENYVIARSEGVVLLIICILFMLYNVVMALYGNKFDEVENSKSEDTKSISAIKSILFIVLGCIGLKFGGDFVVDSCSEIASSFGISEKLISVTIIALGTSLPELVTGITATIKGDIDMAIGNVIGSCILNVCLIIGVSALIKPIEFSLTYNKDLVILTLGTLLFSILPFVGKKDTITRFNGITLLIIYVGYFISTVISA